jgi:hypothetical protein
MRALSKIAENALKNMVNSIESAIFSNNLKEKAAMVRGVGFEPTNPYGTAASGLRL